MKKFFEGVAPQPRFLFSGPGRFPNWGGPLPPRPLPKIEAGKSWHLTLWREPQNQSQQMPKSGRMTEKVCDFRRQGGPLCQSIDLPEGIGAQRPPLVFVVVREKLRLVGCNVDVRRAFRFAGLARETQIERFLDVLVVPAAARHFALQQLNQQVRAPSRPVLFFLLRELTRDHGADAFF